MSRKPSLEEVMRSAFSNLIKGVHTAMPCLVVAVDSNLSTQRVDVKPLINQVTRNNNFSERPLVYAVPVVFPASKRSAFTFPIAVGDVVLCIFSMRGMEAFKSGNGKTANPLDFSAYDIKDAIAIPGLFPFSAAVNNPSARTLPHNTLDASVTHNIGQGSECELRLLANGDIKITTPGKITVQSDTAEVIASSSVGITSPSTTINGDLTVTGSTSLGATVTSSGKDISNTHKHSGVQSGGANTGNPI